MALNTFSFNSLNLTANEITVVSMGPRMAPERSGEFIPIRGRDGYVFIDDEAWRPIPLEITFIMPDNDTYIQDVKSKLTGYGPLTMSTEAGGFYKARVTGPLEFAYWLDQRVVTVSFLAQPFLYLTAGQSEITLTNGGTYNNLGNVNAKPIFTITGSGTVTVTVGGRQFSMYLGASSTVVTINSELVEAYTSTASKNNDMTGAFPYLNTGNNVISWSGGTVSSVKMIPNTMKR